ncbi:hypothetical protein [Burkholderia ambifaria]|uniref:hypothetical protein n=1 Tax=Burkholderia ambifaria TaxID=152480 RepID=UPI003C7EABD0
MDFGARYKGRLQEKAWFGARSVGPGHFPDSTEIFGQFLARDTAIRHVDHEVFEVGKTRNRDALPLHVRQCASEAGTFVCIVEYMAARDCDGIGRGNAEYVIQARVMDMILDAMQGGLDAAPAGVRNVTEIARIPEISS